MTNKYIYNLFLFLSNLTRNLIEVYSVILLYQKGYNLNNIYLFLLIVYITAIITNYISLKINYKYSLIISFILYGISYLYLITMSRSIINIIILGIITSISINTYHTIKHYIAMNIINNDKEKNINIIILIIYLSTIISNIIGLFLIKKIPINIIIFILILLSVISIYPILKLKIVNPKSQTKKINITKNKIIYSILEQFKVILLELQPLYLYIYIKTSFIYIGVFNIIINIASLLVMIIINKYINNKYYKYIIILLGIVLIMKININNKIILLFIALLEGIGMKLYEKNSINNLYDIKNNNIKKYLIIEETIFFTSKAILMLFFLLIIKNLKIIIYICIIGLVASSYFIKEN